MCKEKDCNVSASYGIFGKSPEYCVSHKTEEMINLKIKFCDIPGCQKQGRFGILGEDCRFCKNHKTKSMIDLKSKKCIVIDCSNNALYNFKGSKAEYCPEHKKEGMINVRKKHCAEEGCHTEPNYGIPGGEATHCSKHKKEGMVNKYAIVCKGVNADGSPCTTHAKFGAPGTSRPDYCSVHKPVGHVLLNIRTCELCDKQANFGVKGEKPRFCVEHKLPGMINNKSKQCEDCDKQPNFGFKGGSATHCGDHRKEGMINVKAMLCKECDTRATFANKGEKAEYCATHRKEGMVNVRQNTCEECESVATFGIIGSKPTKCAKHSLSGMRNLKAKYCITEGCGEYAHYGKEKNKPQYCKKCKTPECIYLSKSKNICEEEGCSKQCSFGYIGGKARFCAAHKPKGTINLVNKLCEHPDCYIIAAFGTELKKGRFCFAHKEPYMVNVISNQCEIESCTTKTQYGLPGSPPTHCGSHRLPGMIKKPTGKCITKKCKEFAVYGKNLIARHCEKHKEEDELNLVEKECSSCHLVMILNKDGVCEYCRPETFRAAKLSRQNDLLSYLDSRGLKGDITDKVVDSACGKERPDRVFDLGDKIVIVECDENQHVWASCLCEQTRMINITQSFGGTPVYFIRFNPDDYIPFDEDDKMEPLNKRYKTLGDFIDSIINNKIDIPDALLSVFYMYYDEWESIMINDWEIISNFEK